MFNIVGDIDNIEPYLCISTIYTLQAELLGSYGLSPAILKFLCRYSLRIYK